MIETMFHLSLWCPAPEAPALLDFLLVDGNIQLQATQDANGHSGSETTSLIDTHQRLCAVLKALGHDDEAEGEMVIRLSRRLALPVDQFCRSLGRELDDMVNRAEALRQKQEDLRQELESLQTTLKIAGTPHLRDRADRIRSLWWIRAATYPSCRAHLDGTIAPLLESSDDPVAYSRHESPRPDLLLIELALPRELDELGRQALRKMGARLWLPPRRYGELNYGPAVATMSEDVNRLTRELKAIAVDLEALRRHWGPRLAALLALVERELTIRRTLDHCDRTGDAVEVQGWMPAGRLETFRCALAQRFGQSIALTWREPLHDEMGQVPTSLSQSAAVRPFALFLKLVRPPRYGTTDPTASIGLFFPFFAGCIVGDVGYGLTMLALLWLGCRRFKGPIFADVRFVLSTIAVWGIFWGVAYGEFFGDIGLRLFALHPLWVERSHAVMPVLYFTLAMGLVHVLLGLSFGLIQGVRNGHRRHALEKAGHIFVILGFVACLFAAGETGLPKTVLPWTVGIGATGFALLAIGGGIGAIVESFSTFGNILSYVRIGAIGLSSAILAVTASKFLDTFGLSILGILAALAIHTLNFVMAFAESSLHAARLHYVEFLGKFYDSSGKHYVPFNDRR